MTFYILTDNFNGFFGRLGPSATFTNNAQPKHETIRGLIENPFGRSALRPTTFLHGSYRQTTAIGTMNDVDIVELC